MISRLFSPLLLAAVLAGCASQQARTTVQRIPFPDHEYSQLAKDGNSTLRGQIFMKTRGGDIKFGAGQEIILNPVTSYSDQWYEEHYRKGMALSPMDNRQQTYLRKKISDGSGRFEFKNIPTGEYYVSGVVTWESPTGYQGALQKQGGQIAKKIRVGEKEEIEVILSR